MAKKKIKNMRKKIVKKRSQSGVITTVLLILLVVAAIIVVWNVIYPMLKKTSEEVNTDIFSNRLEVASAKLYVTGGASINVKADSKADINKLKIIFNLKDGTSKSVDKTVSIKPLETTAVNVLQSESNLNNSKVLSVSVIPIFNNKPGLEAKETDSSSKIDSSGNRILDAPAGLVSWWKFDGDAKDSVGGNDGTVNGDAKIQGGSLVLDGNGDYIEIANSPNLNPDNAISLSAWIKLNNINSANADTAIIMGGSTYAITRDERGSINKKIYFYINGGGNYLNFDVTDYNTWQHVVLTYDKNLANSNFKVYLNEIFKNSKDYTTSMGTSPNILLIGKNANQFFNGQINNVMIFNRSLTASEVKAIYNNQK